MARFSVSGRMTSAPTNLLPSGSLYAAATIGGRLLEVGIFNTTATSCQVALRRLTTAGTPGAALDELPHNTVVSSAAANCTGFNTHTSTGPTITNGNFRLAPLGAAIGSGVIWTFGDEGIIIPLGTANGVGILCPTGTGQICDFYFEWAE
jgi:hypothetical protein